MMQIKNNPWYKAYPEPNIFFEHVPERHWDEAYSIMTHRPSREFKDNVGRIHDFLWEEFKRTPNKKRYNYVFSIDDIVELTRENDIHYTISINTRFEFSIYNRTTRTYYLEYPDYVETPGYEAFIKMVTSPAQNFIERLKNDVPVVAGYPSVLRKSIQGEIDPTIELSWIDLFDGEMKDFFKANRPVIRQEFLKDYRLKNYLKYVETQNASPKDEQMD